MSPPFHRPGPRTHWLTAPHLGSPRPASPLGYQHPPQMRGCPKLSFHCPPDIAIAAEPSKLNGLSLAPLRCRQENAWELCLRAALVFCNPRILGGCHRRSAMLHLSIPFKGP